MIRRYVVILSHLLPRESPVDDTIEYSAEQNSENTPQWVVFLDLHNICSISPIDGEILQKMIQNKLCRIERDISLHETSLSSRRQSVLGLFGYLAKLRVMYHGSGRVKGPSRMLHLPRLLRHAQGKC